MKLTKRLALGMAAIAVAFSMAIMPVYAQTDSSTSTSGLEGALLLNNLNNRSSLGDLFVLDRLFGRSSGILSGSNGTNLGDLFVLDQLFGGGSSIFGGGTLSGGGVLGGRSLGDLFVLDRLFAGSGGVLSGSSNTNLGDLFILDQLFR